MSDVMSVEKHVEQAGELLQRIQPDDAFRATLESMSADWRRKAVTAARTTGGSIDIALAATI